MSFCRSGVTVILLSAGFAALAQTEPVDSCGVISVPLPINPVEEIQTPESHLDTHTPHFPVTPGFGIGHEGLRQVNPLATSLPPLGYVPGQAPIYSWGSGGFFATGSRQNLYGLMGIESGTLDFRQRVGALTISLFASATKYGYFRGLSTSYGFGGSLSYDFNDKLGMTVFGSYASSPVGMNQAAMLGYVSSPVIGGYLDWRFADHWGVKVGAQSYRSIAYGRWETQPIVMPYYRTSSGAEIGIDVGGILYQVIRQASGGSWGNPGNPTIGRPDFGPPPVAPRR